MASLYTDQERRERYEKLRSQRRRCEKIRDILMIALIGTSLLMLGVSGWGDGLSLIDASSASHTSMSIVPFAVTPLMTAVCIYALYVKDLRLTVCAMVISLLTAAFSLNANILMPLLMGVASVVDRKWLTLSQEEGFPLFEIPFSEETERKVKASQITRNRALAAGIRTASTERNSEMSDLLDAGSDTELLSAELSGYYERSTDAVAEIVPAEQHDGGTKEL